MSNTLALRDLITLLDDNADGDTLICEITINEATYHLDVVFLDPTTNALRVLHIPIDQ